MTLAAAIVQDRRFLQDMSYYFKANILNDPAMMATFRKLMARAATNKGALDIAKRIQKKMNNPYLPKNEGGAPIVYIVTINDALQMKGMIRDISNRLGRIESQLARRRVRRK